VFFAALELMPDERAEYLGRVCAGDAALRLEVEALLAAHVASGGSASLAGDAEPAEIADGLPPGTRVGAYRLEERVGRGGMGDVYRAERVDEHYRQEVAVKLVRAGGGAAEVDRRFRLERQILANLQHPNIAALLDGGVTADGQPFLVMQYVRGASITAYADARGLGAVARLDLFRTVCDAVQYAHANLVVHRDLKPSNILVTEEGQVRLLDFGIAKLLDARDDDGALALTGDLLLLTPEHAAPEQLQKRPITTATDVYALGVLLYELLTGERPFRGRSALELVRAVCEDEPTRPSAVIAARARAGSEHADDGSAFAARTSSTARAGARVLGKTLHGDLDAIVLKALRKEPDRRYTSAGQFGEDVTRFLEGRPVLARPDTLGYRCRRFAGRNRAAVALASVAAVSLFAGLLGTTTQARRARSEAVQAAAERDRASHVSRLLVDMFRLSDPGATRGRTVTAREVLDVGAARIVTELADQPEAQADLRVELAQIYHNLGLFDEASAHLEQAIVLRQSAFGESDGRVADALTRLAFVRTEQTRADDAVALARAAATIQRARGGDAARIELADALIALGGALRIDASHAEASSAYAEALTLLEQHADEGDARVARAFFGWADAAHNQGQFELADSLLQQTIARYARLGGPPHPEAAASLNNLGMLRMFRRRAADAEPLLREALAMRREIYGPVHPAVAETMGGLAQALTLLGRFREAEPVGADAVAVADSALGRTHASAAVARQALALILVSLDEGDRALDLLHEARRVYVDQFGADHARVVGSDIMIAQAHAAAGRFEQARASFEHALRSSEAALGPENAYQAHILMEIARLDFDAGRLNDAEASARASIALATKRLRPDHRFALWATSVLAQVEMARGALPAADSLLRGVIATQRQTLGDDHPETARTLVLLADAERRRGRIGDAEASVRAAIAVLQSHDVEGPVLYDARSVLGATLAAHGVTAEAVALLRGAARDLARARSARPAQVAAAAERLRLATGVRRTGG
jgi:eukaryotic-like serine/threonine-protein kinase